MHGAVTVEIRVAPIRLLSVELHFNKARTQKMRVQRSINSEMITAPPLLLSVNGSIAPVCNIGRVVSYEQVVDEIEMGRMEGQKMRR
jgi:hypothetical protein